MRKNNNKPLSLTIVLFCYFSFAHAEEHDWAVTLYSAMLSGDKLFETITFSADYDGRYHFVAAALSRKLGNYDNKIDFELEGQLVRHTGLQRYSEYNAVFIARWHPFPWDNIVDTSFAIGNGLSYATEMPEIELLHHPKSSKFLNYLLLELTFTVPSQSDWHIVTRIHHRSGMFGTFSDVYGASNAWGLGVRYTF